MINYETKQDNVKTSAGKVTANEYNSIMGEQKSLITPFMTPNDLDSRQTLKATDIISKAMFYEDTGTVNNVILSRGATTSTFETLFDGMVVFFKPKFNNTGSATLKIKTLSAKTMKHNGSNLSSGFLKTSYTYMAVYNSTGGFFDVDYLIGKSPDAELLDGKHLNEEGVPYLRGYRADGKLKEYTATRPN